jgi:hypothetical protein
MNPLGWADRLGSVACPPQLLVGPFQGDLDLVFHTTAVGSKIACIEQRVLHIFQLEVT